MNREKLLVAAKELYEALEMMYEQYCPEPYGHMFMTAGKNADEMLDKYSDLIN